MKTAISRTQYVAAAVIAGAFAVGFMSGPAFADNKQKSEDFNFKFSYEPEEFATTDSASKLLTRLEGQVSKFCAGKAATGTRLRTVDKKCIKATMDQTVESFKSSVVAEVYKGRADG
jgi:UrcA family protein